MATDTKALSREAEVDRGTRYAPQAMEATLNALFRAAGLGTGKADAVARNLVAADMSGYATHGCALAPWYLEALQRGEIARTGDFEVVSDAGACVAWRGNRLPGAWLMERAIELALERVPKHGIFAMTIAGGQHVGALGVYLERLTSHNLVPMLTCSGPAAAGVAPYGGIRPVITPNPIAFGIPTRQAPVLLDISTSITTLNMARQLARAGQRFDGQWGLDSTGAPTDDPIAVLNGGSLLPIGGLDHGHKGYGLGLMVEALTQGLGGLGRHQRPQGMLMNVYLQVTDPAAFGGRDTFLDESDWLVDACRSSPARPGMAAVRVPGESASNRWRDAQANGVLIGTAAHEGLRPWLDRYEIAWPPALAVGKK